MRPYFHYVMLGLMIITLSSCMGKLDVSINDILPSVLAEPPIMSAANVTVAEEAGTGVFTVTLDKAYTSTVTVDYVTSSSKVSEFEDYVGVLPKGTLTFLPGELSKTISITLKNDVLPENAEDIDLTLSNSSVGPNTTTTAKMTITDSDSPFFGADVATIHAIKGPTVAPAYSFVTTNSVTVDPSGSADFTTIQDAINAALPGTEIVVNSGFYPEALNINGMGQMNGNPIVLRAASGHTPVISGANAVSPGTLINDNTDGGESASQAFSFEDGTANGFNNYIETNNTQTNVTGVTGTPLGSRAFQLGFGGTHSQNMIWNTFPNLENLNGGEYRARFMFKLNAAFALDGSLDASVGRAITLMRVERETETASRMNIELFPHTNANSFRLRLYKNNSVVANSILIARDAWVTVDFYYKKATSVAAADGIVKMFVNGAEISTATHAITSDHNRFRLGSIVSVYDSVSVPAVQNCPISTQTNNACVVNGSNITFDAIRIEEGSTVPVVSDVLSRTIYENGFETDLSAFTASVGGSNSAAISTTTPWDGSQTARFTFAGTSAQNSLRRSITDNSSDIFARVNFRLNSSFNLAEDAAQVTSPTNTSEYAKEFDLLSLYGSTGSSGRLKVSLLKQGTRLFLLGKIINIKDGTSTTLNWNNDIDISNYLQIYKGHIGEVDRNVWNNLEIRYAGNKTLKSGVEIWLNGVSIASNINRVTGKYEGLSTSGLDVDTIQLGTAADNNLGGSPVVSMQTTVPTNGSEIAFDGLKITSGAPAGYGATGVTPIVYRFPFTAPGADEGIPNALIIDTVKLHKVSNLSQLTAGTFYVNTYKMLVYFRFPLDVNYSAQTILSGRRNSVLNITNSSNIVLKDLNFNIANNSDMGCVQMLNSKKIKIIGNSFIACAGPAINNSDDFSASNRSDDLLISGNTISENGKVSNGSITLNHIGNVKIENNLIRSSTSNGIYINCAYDNGGSYNLTTNFCQGYTIARNLMSQSVNSSVYLNGNVSGTRIYSNQLSSARESGYLNQVAGGAWVNLGGSAVELAKESNNNFIYNNVISATDKAGVLVHSAARNNAIFNNTIAETGVNVVTGGSSIDFHADVNELNVDHRDPTQSNVSYNNIYSQTYGHSPCVNLDGNDGSDQSNMTNRNIFFSCAAAGKYNSTSYSSLAGFTSAIGSTYGSRENHSQEYVGTLYDLVALDLTLDAGVTFSIVPQDIRVYMP